MKKRVRTFLVWLPFLAGALLVGALAVFRGLRPPDPLPAPPPVDATEQVRTDLVSLSAALTSRGVPLRTVMCPNRGDAFYVMADGADSSILHSIPAQEEYADCWQGVALCTAQAGECRGPEHPDPYRFHIGPFRFFGDPAVLEAIRPAFPP